jgi:hypothetical protein
MNKEWALATEERGKAAVREGSSTPVLLNPIAASKKH